MDTNDSLARAQRNANLSNLYFAHRALTASAFSVAFDFRKAVPSITREESEALAIAMHNILAEYRTEAENSYFGPVGKAL